MNQVLPEPRPVYSRPEGGHLYFNPGDIVRIRDPLEGCENVVGVVVVQPISPDSEKLDWFVLWESGELDTFDDISGDSLIIVFHNRLASQLTAATDWEPDEPSVPTPVNLKDASVTREYKVTVNMWVEYETEDGDKLPCGLGEYIDEHIDPLSVLHEHLVLDIRSAIWQLSLTEGPDINVRAGGADVVNVSDVTGE